ncbi:MAG: hypothetical protein K6E58_01105 [Eubacterium sp.]|nr:hypothetical protein [Eubacterium sp.]
MKTIKKLIAPLMALVLTLTMTFSIGAAAISGTDTGEVETTDTTVTIPKGITLVNLDAAGQYYSADIDYTYTIAPAEMSTFASQTVTDDDSNTGTVHAGPTGGVTITGTPSFDSALNNFTTTGNEITDTIDLSTDLSKFSKPGIYRYTITDTTATSALFGQGMNRPDDYQTVRYLDVYLHNNATSGNLEVYGYTLQKESGKDSSNKIQLNKDPGYIKSSEASSGYAGTDVYETYNVTLTKSVTGTLGDKNHEFPFVAEINNNGYQYLTAKNSATATAQTAATTSVNTTLKHSDVFHINGLNSKATVGYTETNDTTDTYEVTVNGSSSTLVAASEVAPNGTKALTAGAITSYAANNSATSIDVEGTDTQYSGVTFVNNIDEVSPTGVILRFLPFVLILGCGIALLVLTRRNRRGETGTRAI